MYFWTKQIGFLFVWGRPVCSEESSNSRKSFLSENIFFHKLFVHQILNWRIFSSYILRFFDICIPLYTSSLVFDIRTVIKNFPDGESGRTRERLTCNSKHFGQELLRPSRSGLLYYLYPSPDLILLMFKWQNYRACQEFLHNFWHEKLFV